MSHLGVIGLGGIVVWATIMDVSRTMLMNAKMYLRFAEGTRPFKRILCVRRCFYCHFGGTKGGFGGCDGRGGVGAVL